MRNIYFLLIVFFLILTQRISFAIDNIVINGLFKDKVVVTIDGKQKILKKNKLTADGLRLIKANSKEATIEINGTSKIFTLDEKIVSTFSEGKHTPLTTIKKVKIKADNSGQTYSGIITVGQNNTVRVNKVKFNDIKIPVLISLCNH